MATKKRTTIIISPRERFLSLLPSLKSLFLTIENDVPVVLVDGGAPKSVCVELQKLQEERYFEWIHTDHFLTPHETRNIGFEQVNTEFVVFADNDMYYENDWLSSLETNADLYKSDIVAPLICIGPPTASIVHHAGGRLFARNISTGGIELREKHQFMNRPISDLKKDSPPVDNQVAEFHCFLARSECIREFGPLDERLITREQMDLALRAIAYGKRVTFEKSSIVTYMANENFKTNDLDYILFRWSEILAKQSINAFCESWNVYLDSKRILYDWIENHRMKAIVSAYPLLSKIMGRRIFSKYAKNFIEAPRTERVFSKREKRDLSLPFPINSGVIEKVLKSIPLETNS